MKTGVLFTGRIISSFGGGVITSTIPLYHSEIAPADIRGRLISLFSVMVSTGTLVGYFVTFGTSYLTTSWSWRAVWIIHVIFCAALCVFAWFLPFSPRWLIDHGRHEEALYILSSLRELPIDHQQVVDEYSEIKAELEVEHTFGNRTYIELFKKGNLMRTYMSAGLAAGSALTGTQVRSNL
jgi:MFS family permease